MQGTEAALNGTQKATTELATSASDNVVTRNRMIDISLELIARHGYEGTSLQMVADATGVTKAAVYYYFKTKSDLLDAILHQVFEGAPSLPNPRLFRSRRSRLTWLAEHILDRLTHHRHAISVINADPVIEQHPTFVALVSETRELALRAVYGDTPTAAERAAFHLASCAVHTLPKLGDLSDSELVEALRPAIYRTLGLPAPPEAEGLSS